MFRAGLLVVAACTSGMQETVVVEQGACTALEGRTFTAPDGGQLSFDVESSRASQFTWLRGEVGETGYVSCNGAVLTATTGTRTLQATFDAKALRLSWGGAIYAAQ